MTISTAVVRVDHPRETLDVDELLWPFNKPLSWQVPYLSPNLAEHYPGTDIPGELKQKKEWRDKGEPYGPGIVVDGRGS